MTTRLLAFGDCNTLGSEQLPPGECVPAKLADRLRAAGGEVVLDNQGGTMNCSREGVARVRRVSEAADVVLLNYGLVDSWVTSVPWLHVAYFPDNPLRKQARKLLKSVKRRLRSPAVRRVVGEGVVVRPQEFAANVRRVVDAVRAKSPGCRVVLWGTVPVRGDADRNASIAGYDAVLRDVAAEKGYLWFDTRAFLANLPEETVYLDNVHLNPEGASRVADAMAEVVEGRRAAAA